MLALLLCLVGSFRNLTFLPVIVINTLIGIIQEIRSKKVLDELNMLNVLSAVAVRSGELVQVSTESLVIDDIVILKQGIRSARMQL